MISSRIQDLFAGYYAYGEELDNLGYFEDYHGDLFKVYDFILCDEHPRCKEFPQLQNLPQVKVCFSKYAVVLKTVRKEAIFVINNSYFLNSDIVYYEGMKNVYGISKKHMQNNEVEDIGPDEFPFASETNQLLYKRYEEYMFRCMLREKIQHSLRASRGKGFSLSGVSLTNCFIRHMDYLARYVGSDGKKIVVTGKFPSRVVLIQKQESIFPDIVRQCPLIIRCSVKSLESFLGSRFSYYPILPAHYTLGGFREYHFSVIPSLSVMEFLLDKNSAYLQVKANMTTLSFSALQYSLREKDIELYNCRHQLMNKCFKSAEDNTSYQVVYIERIVMDRYKRGRNALADKYRIWLYDTSSNFLPDDISEPTLINRFEDPVDSTQRERYCKYIDNHNLFDLDNLTVAVKFKSVKRSQGSRDRVSCENEQDIAELEADIEEELNLMEQTNSNKRLRKLPELYSPFNEKPSQPSNNTIEIPLLIALKNWYPSHLQKEPDKRLQKCTKYFLDRIIDAVASKVKEIDIKRD